MQQQCQHSFCSSTIRVWRSFPCSRRAHGLLHVCIAAELVLLRFADTRTNLWRNVQAPLARWLGRKMSQTERVKGSGFVGTKVNNLKDKRGPVSLTLKWKELLETGCDITESLYNGNHQEFGHWTLFSALSALWTVCSGNTVQTIPSMKEQDN